MTWQPCMEAVCVVPIATLQLGCTYEVERVVHGGRLDRDGLNGDGLVLKGVPIPRGYTGFDARRFLKAGRPW